MNVYEIAKDGLPDLGDESLTGRIAFIFDGCIISGWPLYNIHLREPGNNYPEYSVNDWEANDDVGRKGVFTGVQKYVIFDVPVWEL